VSAATTTSAAPAAPAPATALPLGTFAAYAAEVLGTFVLVLFLLVRSLGAASGAHFNPAMFLVTYVLGPILGALAAAALYTEIVLKPQERVEQRPSTH
jgi:glycerol uptake facilitator-like aquaporin